MKSLFLKRSTVKQRILFNYLFRKGKPTMSLIFWLCRVRGDVITLDTFLLNLFIHQNILTTEFCVYEHNYRFGTARNDFRSMNLPLFIEPTQYSGQ